MSTPESRETAAPAVPAWQRYGGLAVHVLTGSGAVWALLALAAAVERDFSAMFLWLILAVFVDGIDGPLARATAIQRSQPRFDGTMLDLIVDYLTYVFVPAYALAVSGLMPYDLGLAAAALICLTAGLWFAQIDQKTEDNYFRGFPALWNLVVFLLFLYTPSAAVSFIVVLVLAAATFAPIDFVHPVRVARWRPVTLVVTLASVALSILVLVYDFAPPGWVIALITVGVVYVVGVGLVRSAERATGRGPAGRA